MLLIVALCIGQMKDISPQVLAAARVVLDNPDNKPALEHFTAMKKEWVDNANELTRLVDSATDSLEFLKVSEAKVKADVEHAKDLVRREEDPTKVVATAGSVGRQANRVLQFAQQEAQNSDDQAYVNKLTTASDKLSKSIGPMLVEAKSVVSDPKSKAQQEKFCKAADQVAEHVSAIRAVVEDNWVPPRPPLPEFTEEEEAPPLPPPPPEILEPVPDDMMEAEQILRGPVVDKEKNPVTFAAMGAFHEADKWEEKDNTLVSLAKQMARKMAMMSKYMSGEASDVHSKADLIKCAKEIAASAQEMLKLAKQIANDCTDKRLKANLMQRIDKIPTISTQLKILANVKATTMGGDEKADQDATEMLVGNAQNLMGTVKDVIRAAEAACIRLRPGSPVASVIWRRKGGQARRLSLE
jgi:vinculin